MRVALVSPYSYTYPGGVGRHVEALAQELSALGHEVRLLAPYDPDDRLARVTHRGARPQQRPLPDYVIPLGRTIGLPMNGAVSNLPAFPEAVGDAGPRAAQRRLRRGARARAERAGRVLVRGRGARACRRSPPSTPTPPARSSNQLAANVARSAPALLEAERAHRGLRGRALDRPALLRRPLPDRARTASTCPPRGPTTRARTTSCGSLFVGRAEERKGLPVLLRAFEALRGAGRRRRA